MREGTPYSDQDLFRKKKKKKGRLSRLTKSKLVPPGIKKALSVHEKMHEKIGLNDSEGIQVT